MGHAGSWLTTSRDESIPSAWQDSYNKQVRLYAAMLGEANVTVGEAYILLTSTGEALAVSLDEEPAS